MAVHEENQQFIYWEDSEINQDNIADNIDSMIAKKSETTLTAYFKQCQKETTTPLPLQQLRKGPPATALTYEKFCQYYTYNKTARFWTRRKNENTQVSRLDWVNPKERERFHLRTLLFYAKGAISFQDLKHFNGKDYETYEEVCVARGLIEDEKHLHDCLEEASHFQGSRTLRKLFFYIISQNTITKQKTLELWHEFKDTICTDVLLEFRTKTRNRGLQMCDEVYDAALYEISQWFADDNKDIIQFGLPPGKPPSFQLLCDVLRYRGFADDQVLKSIAEDNEKQMNNSQKEYVYCFMCFFICLAHAFV